METISTSEDETEAIGRELAATLSGGSCLALHGELGAGKTVFARGLARGLGIEEVVSSPTFTIVQEYLGNKLNLYHIDLYRLNNSQDAINFGLEDFLGDPSAVTVIEWPERIRDLYETNWLHVHLDHEGKNRRIRVCSEVK